MIKGNRSIQDILRDGKESEFWDILVDSLEHKIDDLREEQAQDIGALPAAEYKLTNEVLLAKIDFLKKLQELPDEIVESLNDIDEEDENDPDPYSHPKDF